MILDDLIKSYDGHIHDVEVWEKADGGFMAIFGLYGQSYDVNGNKQGFPFQWTKDRPGIPAILLTREKIEEEIEILADLIKSYDGIIGAKVWMIADGGFMATFGLYGQRYDVSGNKQGIQFQWTENIPGIPAPEHRILSDAIPLADGGFLMTWITGNGWSEDYVTHAERYDANSNKQGAKFALPSTDSYQQNILHSAISLTGGDLVIIWNTTEFKGLPAPGVKGRLYDADGNWKPSSLDNFHESISDLLVGDPDHTIGPDSYSVAGLSDGGFVVTFHSEWRSFTTSNETIWNNIIYSQRYDASGNPQGAQIVQSHLVDHASLLSFSVTGLDDDGFLVTWEFEDPTLLGSPSLGVNVKRYDTNGNEVEGVTPNDLSILPSPDRLFNWAEIVYDDLFPGHPASQEIEGYHARIYENGNALGELNNDIYFYDGNSITLVGTVNDFLPDAISAGF